MNDVQPVSLQKSDDRELIICWSDGFEQSIPFRELRDACQCATCMEKKGEQNAQPAASLPVLSAAETLPLEIVQMNPVGNYAYNIHFSDGHTTGIFTFEMLLELA